MLYIVHTSVVPHDLFNEKDNGLCCNSACLIYRLIVTLNVEWEREFSQVSWNSRKFGKFLTPVMNDDGYYYR
jgi:hypothetical protein